MTNSVGKKISAARERIRPRLTRADLARRLKAEGLSIDAQEVAEIEAGTRPVNYYQISLIASILNTTTTQLLS